MTTAETTAATPSAATEEYERRPVPASALKDWRSFLGMYAGEHTAGTELMIGPLFLAAGVSAIDLVAGLLLGNLLAVLSWRFICAPVATQARLTLYYQLEKICGRGLVTVYNLANGVLFCFLAGAMITVSATAVGIPFNMPMPGLQDATPDSWVWVAVVLAIGVVISVVAARGYSTVARFANIAAPWMILVFLALGLVAVQQLNVNSWAEFWAVLGRGGEPLPGQLKFSFWHVLFFAWFCNAAMHVGMADLTILRYAKHPRVGWTTASGMYIGHFMAWIAAALLYAVYLRSPEAAGYLTAGEAPPVAPGPMAYQALGITGLILVIVAGWTTANPTIYRAGLAFQAIMPKASTTVVTLLAGALATLAGIFPAFAMKLLGFVATYGFVLAPVGAIIFFNHFFAPRIGLTANWAEANGRTFNPAVLAAWLISLLFFYWIAEQQAIFLSFLTLPAWLACGALFLLFSKLQTKYLASKPQTTHA